MTVGESAGCCKQTDFSVVMSVRVKTFLKVPTQSDFSAHLISN